MATWTLFVYCGVSVGAAEAAVDDEVVKELHAEADLLESDDAAVIERDDHKGQVKMVKKYETTPHVGAREEFWPRAGLVVVAVAHMGAKVRSAMKRAHEFEEKQLGADQKELEAAVAEAEVLDHPVPHAVTSGS
jgi:hypothetical protein